METPARSHLLDPTLRVPHVIGDFAKNAVADHHSRAAWLVVIKPDEAAVAIFRIKIGPVARQNVCVQIDFHEIVGRLCQTPSQLTISAFTETPYNAFTGSGFGTLVPHFLQVRRASSFQKSSIAWLKCSTISAQSKSNVFHQCAAIFAIENHVLLFSRRATTLHHDADRVRRPLGRSAGHSAG